MFKAFVCATILVTAVSAGYDFKDSDFNEFLFDDLRADLANNLEESTRFRREVEVTAAPEQKDCHRKKDREHNCCNGDKMDPKQFDALKEVKMQCIAEIRGDKDDDTFDPFNCEQMQVMKEQMVCTAECVAKKFNLIDESGALKRDVLLTHMRAKIGDNKWKADALEGNVDKCLAEVKAAKDVQAKSDKKKGCSPCSLQFTHCIWREFAQGCPAELQVDSGKCKKIRERLAKGDTSHLNKAFLHHFHHHDDKKSME